MEWIADYNAQVRASNNRTHQAILQMSVLRVCAETSQAASIEEEDYRHDFVELFRAISQAQQQIITLKDCYNALVDDFNKYAEASHEQLETETKFLNAAKAPDGTYNSITLTFANPQLTILNQTGAPTMAGSQTCASGQMCEFKPTTENRTLESCPKREKQRAGACAKLSLAPSRTQTWMRSARNERR